MRLEGYSNYEIYPETGRVFSYKSNRFVGVKTDKGYWHCVLTSDDGKEWSTLIHRVIWITVNGEIPDGMEINHIDENRNNNSISNLSLMTHKENINWGTRNKKASKSLTNHPKKSKPVFAFKNDTLKLFFLSTKEAERNGFCHNHINKCCQHIINHNSHKGYQWRYLDDVLGDWLEEIQDEDMKLEKGYN